MRITLNGQNYNLKVRTELLEPKLEAIPAKVATKTLSELSAKELSIVMNRVRRNLRRQESVKGVTTISLFKVDAENVETLLETTQVSNCNLDTFDKPRGRREALDKLKEILKTKGTFTAKDLREVTIAFYNRYPKSRPNYETLT